MAAMGTMPRKKKKTTEAAEISKKQRRKQLKTGKDRQWQEESPRAPPLEVADEKRRVAPPSALPQLTASATIVRVGS
jgi:hypothetical protein